MTFTKKQSQEAKKELRHLFHELKTSTVFVVQRHVSRSGMQRQLDLYILPSIEAVKDHGDKLYDIHEGTIAPVRITYRVAQALQWTYSNKYDALTVNGCGMDMHFHTVYSLSCALYCDDKYDHDSAYRLKHITL